MTPTLGTTALLDRQGLKRSDEAYLAGLLARSDTRFMILADQKPVIRGNKARTEAAIRWLSRSELETAGLPFAPEELLFLQQPGSSF